MLLFLLFCLAVCSTNASTNASKKPNIVYFITDDQDQMLGASFPIHNSATPLSKTKDILQNKGSMATNFFIHTPICCPSRSELISGRYFHNIKINPTAPPLPKNGNCMHVNVTQINDNTFARHLNESGGYRVGMFGKYLNAIPNMRDVPRGFDAWMANGGGRYLAPQFSTANLDFVNISDGTWKGTSDNYTTAVVGNVSIAWIREVVKEDKHPFFAYIAPKACHEPFIPAPWYVDHWNDTWPLHEPRNNPAYNSSFEMRSDHHGNIATNPLITPEGQEVITGVFKNRWRVLMSVDDVIDAVITELKELNVIDNTYIFYTSDHGFQLGEFNMLMDKRHVYDWDTRVHLLTRGPGILPGSTWHQPATQVDLAATWMGIAGLDIPADMDGKSLLPILINDVKNAPSTVQQHISNINKDNVYLNNWRDAAFIEYYYVAVNDKCVQNCTCTNCLWPETDCDCVDLKEKEGCWGPDKGSVQPNCNQECYPTENTANNYIALRSVGDVNTLYAEFATGNQDLSDIDFNTPDFYEYYNSEIDPWQVNNLHSSTDSKMLKKLHVQLHEYFNCKGIECP